MNTPTHPHYRRAMKVRSHDGCQRLVRGTHGKRRVARSEMDETSCHTTITWWQRVDEICHSGSLIDDPLMAARGITHGSGQQCDPSDHLEEPIQEIWLEIEYCRRPSHLAQRALRVPPRRTRYENTKFLGTVKRREKPWYPRHPKTPASGSM
ncbi:hypothetical protein F4604DRAFT_1681379 [Suillus subluteus]|nr:hypothetical protein F4604DRAFT_1681379 [Suillus subluteus]